MQKKRKGFQPSQNFPMFYQTHNASFDFSNIHFPPPDFNVCHQIMFAPLHAVCPSKQTVCQ